MTARRLRDLEASGGMADAWRELPLADLEPTLVGSMAYRELPGSVERVTPTGKAALLVSAPSIGDGRAGVARWLADHGCEVLLCECEVCGGRYVGEPPYGDVRCGCPDGWLVRYWVAGTPEPPDASTTVGVLYEEEACR